MKVNQYLNLDEKTPINVFITPHFHYDYLWCDSPDGMGVKSAKVIKHALLLMRKYPEYKFAIDSVMAVEYFKLHYPDLWEELKKRVKERRMVLMGGMIVAPDTLMPNGESLVRQFLYGSNYFKEQFGIESKIGYLLDSFGQTPQLPQILKKAGFDYFMFWRGAGNRNLPSEFYWKALDGSKILTHWLSRSYTWFTLPFTGTILPPVYPFAPVPFSMNLIPQNFKVYDILKKLFPPIKYFIQRLNKLNAGVDIIGSDSGGLTFTIENRLKRATSPNIFILNGTDNIPPSSNIVDVVDYFQASSSNYKVNIAAPMEFFKSLTKSKKHFGVIGPYEFSGLPDKFPGTYNNRVRLKQKIRNLENLFYCTELFCSLSTVYGDNEYPYQKIKEAIIRILCCDFHDGICGCCVDAAYDHMMKMLDLSEIQLKKAYRKALIDFSDLIEVSHIRESATPLLIFNPVSKCRTDTVSIIYTMHTDTMLIKDEEGKEVPFQKNSLNSKEEEYILRAQEIPSLGYKTYSIEEPQLESEPEEDIGRELEQYGVKYRCNEEIINLETERFELVFEDNKILSIRDKKNDFTLKSSKFHINDLRIHNERGDSYLNGKDPKEFGTTFDNTLEIIESGPVRVVVELKSKLVSPSKIFSKPINEITQYIILYNFKSSRIDFITKFTNNIRNVRIQACFPVSFKNPHFHSEVPYGFYPRDIKPAIGKSWEEFKPKFSHYDRVFPVINWMDASEPNKSRGFSVINCGMPEYELGESRDFIYLTLLKSTGYISNLFPGSVPMILGPFYAIPKAFELTDQEFHYSLFFHDGKLEENHVAAEALMHNIPLIAQKIQPTRAKLEASAEFIRIEPENAFLITTLKKPEEGPDDLIIRLYSTLNISAQGTLTFHKMLKGARLVNLLEQPIQDLEIREDRMITFHANPQEILTFAVKFL
ncbi:MAG: hypothetical protein EU544_04035 [Promethearchaeota archaeon]|nr:MAG: hypothetical protein EU544_04035 [Candidatus Lokiarchaeota archaeon]